MTTLDITMPNGERGPAEVLQYSPRETYAVVKLTGTPHKGTVDVFHVGAGQRATPPRHFGFVRNRKVAVAVADFLDEQDPVATGGKLRIERDEYHSKFDALVSGLA